MHLTITFKAFSLLLLQLIFVCLMCSCVAGGRWCSVQLSHSVESNPYWTHGLQHARLPCPSPSPGAHSNSCPLSQMPSNHLVLYCPLHLPSIFPSIKVFSSESALHVRWPKDWSYSFSISPSNEYSRLISFRIDWFELLAVQGTLKSLLHHHSSKASVLQCSAFFKIRLSLPYMTMGKTIPLTRQTFVSKLMSLLFSMLSSCLCFSSKEQASFNFMAAVTICNDFGVQKNKVSHYFQFPHLFAMKRWDRMPWS